MKSAVTGGKLAGQRLVGCKVSQGDGKRFTRTAPPPPARDPGCGFYTFCLTVSRKVFSCNLAGDGEKVEFGSGAENPSVLPQPQSRGQAIPGMCESRDRVQCSWRLQKDWTEFCKSLLFMTGKHLPMEVLKIFF